MPRLPFFQHNINDRLTPDKHLVDACLRGDATAWDALIARYAALIYSLCLRSGLSPSNTEDVFQDVCVLMMDHLAELRDTSKLSSWLISITKREIWRVRKRNSPKLASELGEGEWEMEGAESLHSQKSNSPEADILALEDQQLMRQALVRLPDRCRELLTALYGRENPLSYEDLAARFSLPIGSIGPTRGRCLERLRKILAELGY